jgi:hypothetical protein
VSRRRREAHVIVSRARVPSSWLLAQARARNVPHHKLGHYVRFDLDELIGWLEETRVAPAPQRGRR